jgi:membrane fusion protein, heavy metal efflux system
MRSDPIAFITVAAALGWSAWSCNKSNPHASAPASAERNAHATPEAKVEAEEHGSSRHDDDKEPQKPSDLDRPVEELFTATCEHKKKTFECDECRYEIGVVRAPRSLLDGSLFKIVKATRQRVAAPVTLSGEVRFDERRVAHVSTQTEGIVKAAFVTLGDPVKKGQALIELQSVAMGEAQATFLEAQATRELARRSYERVAALRKENIASEKEYLQARQDLESAKIRMEGALGKLTRLGMGSGEARSLTQSSARGRLLLRSPVDGSVLVLHAVPGEVAKTQESLVTVGDNARVWVWANLYERDIATVSSAQAKQKLASTVMVKAYPNEEFAGTVDFLSPAMEEASRTVKVRVEVKNPNRRLLAGMFATVKLFLPGTDEALAVPREAVLEDEGRSFVFVHHHGDYYVRRPVSPGRSWAGLVEVRKGLSVGQEVVGDGAFLMKSDVLRSKMGAGCAD